MAPPDVMPWEMAGQNAAPSPDIMPWEMANKPQTDYAEDALKSFGAGAGKSGANMASEIATSGPIEGLANIVARPIVQGATRLAGAAYTGAGGELSEPWARLLTYPMGGDPDNKQEQVKELLANKVIPQLAQQETGMNMNYQPQTRPGEYAESVGGAVPYMAMGAPPLTTVGMGLGQQAGKDVASQFTDNPKYQEAASVVGGGVGAMAAPSISAGMNDMLKDESSVPRGKLPSYTSDQIKDAAVAGYKNSESMGGQVPINDMRQAVQGMLTNKDIGQQTARGQAFAGENPVTTVLAKLQDAVKDNSPWTIADANEIDDSLRDEIAKTRRSGDYQSARSLGLIKNALRDVYADAANTNPQQAAGFNEWIRADKLYAAGSRAEEMQDMIENANKADVPSTAIKNAFKNFVKDSDNKTGLTDEEWDAANHASKYGVITPILKTLGSRMSGHIAGGLTGLGIGGPVGGIAGYALGNAAVAPLRWGANALQEGRAQAIPDMISQRPVVQEALNPNYKPPIPATSAAPMMPTIPAIGAALGNNQPKPATGGIGDQNTQELQKLKTQMQSGASKVGGVRPAQPALPPQSNAGDFFAKEAQAESGGNPNAKNPNSSASGKFQFTDPTWNQMVKRYGQQTGITLHDKDDPDAQAVMAKLYAKDNIQRMQPFLQRMPTKGEVYAAHVLGADGALRLINAANETPEKQAIMLFSRAVTSGNKGLFFQGNKPLTALQVYQNISKKVES